jgi:hypothetical protein
MKTVGDDGNPLNVNIVEPEEPPNAPNPPVSRPNEFDSNVWLSGDTQLPTRERSTGPFNGGFVESQSSGTNDMSVSPNPESISNRPTPNSSSNSEQRHSTSNGAARSNSGRTSFDASPINLQQALGSQAEMDATTAAFFQNHANFGLPDSGTGMTPGREFVMPDTPSGGFGVPNGWEMPASTGMTPVAEGVLRHLINMPPMDAMDLGWDSTH